MSYGTAFIDYAGPKVTLKNPVSQVTIEVPIFIMVLEFLNTLI